MQRPVGTAGMGQHRRDGYDEPALVTLGADLERPKRLDTQYPNGWSASTVVAWLSGGLLPE